MIFRSILVGFLITSATGNQGSCSVCGTNKEISIPDAIFSFPGQPSVSCDSLQAAGEFGLIPQDDCAFLPMLIVTLCGCVLTPSVEPEETGPDVLPSCSVCGENLEVSNPDAVFSFPGQPSVSCGTLQTAGETGLIPLDDCEFLPALVDDLCECVPQGSDVLPIESCSVCGDNLEVSNPNAVFEFPGQPTVSCGNLEIAGESGLIELDDCAFLPALIDDVCGCVPRGSDIIKPSHPPTVAPTRNPTPNPTRNPTPDPTHNPTPNPTPNPTHNPTHNPTTQPVANPTPNPTREPTPGPTSAATETPAGTRVCPEIPSIGCSICGPDQCVHDFSAKFGAISCGYWEEAGLGGAIEKGICDMFPANGVAAACDCRATVSTPRPTPAPSPTSALPGTRVCPSIPSNGCSICGPDQCVHNPEAMFGEYSCGYWEAAGLGGAIEKDICDMFPANGVTAACDCRSTAVSTPQPTPAPSPTPALPGTRVCPSIPSNGCSICGPDQCVHNPDAMFGEYSCGYWEAAGLGGAIEKDICDMFPANGVAAACDCRSTAIPTPQPTPATNPTSNVPGTRECPSTPSNGCSICGPDQCVHNPDAMFGNHYSCGYWEAAGLGGAIEKNICDMFPANGVAAACDCRTTVPTPQPVSTPAPVVTPVGSRVCPSTPSNGCSVCGPNRCVNNPTARFGFQDQDFEFTCQQWENFGLNGQIENNICVQLPAYLESTCACLTSAVASDPLPVPQPNFRPVPSPTTPTTVIYTAQPQVRTRPPTRPPSNNHRPGHGKYYSKKERRQRK